MVVRQPAESDIKSDTPQGQRSRPRRHRPAPHAQPRPHQRPHRRARPPSCCAHYQQRRAGHARRRRSTFRVVRRQPHRRGHRRPQLRPHAGVCRVGTNPHPTPGRRASPPLRHPRATHRAGTTRRRMRHVRPPTRRMPDPPPHRLGRRRAHRPRPDGAAVLDPPPTHRPQPVHHHRQPRHRTRPTPLAHHPHPPTPMETTTSLTSAGIVGVLTDTLSGYPSRRNSTASMSMSSPNCRAARCPENTA